MPRSPYTPHHRTFNEDRFEVRPSSIPGIGMGLFTRSTLNKGDPVGFYTGIVLTDRQANSPKYVDSAYLLWICKDHWILGEGPESNFTRYINHSDKPNCELVVSTRWKTARIRALKRIPAGRELFFDYGEEYWENIGVSKVPV